MAGGAAKRAKRGEKAEAEPFIVFDSDRFKADIDEYSLILLYLENYSHGESCGVKVSMWRKDMTSPIDMYKPWSLLARLEEEKAKANGTQLDRERFVVYDSDMWVHDLDQLQNCARVQVTLYGFSPGERACRDVVLFPFPEIEDVDDTEKKSTEARAALRAAIRAAERAQQRAMFTGNHLEEGVLRQQLAAMQEDHAIETTDEYELVTRRFDALSHHTAQKQVLELQAKTYQYQLAQQSLKVAEPAAPAPTKAFDCGICLDEKPLSAVRLAMPCGHAFCAECIAAHKEANRTRDAGCEEKGCPVCRGPIDSVFKPRL